MRALVSCLVGMVLVCLFVRAQEAAADEGDQAGLTASETITTDGTPPTAKLVATPLKLKVGQEVEFDGSGSTDADGKVVDYAFDFDGDGKFDVISTDPFSQHTFDAPGRYLARLQVSDNDALLSAIATAEITVVANELPIAAIQVDPLTAQVGKLINFDAFRSKDPDGRIERYLFDTDFDGDYEKDNGGNTNYDVIFDTPGTYTVAVQVVDDSGDFSTNLAVGSIVITQAPKDQVAIRGYSRFVLGKQYDWRTSAPAGVVYLDTGDQFGMLLDSYAFNDTLTFGGQTVPVTGYLYLRDGSLEGIGLRSQPRLRSAKQMQDFVSGLRSALRVKYLGKAIDRAAIDVDYDQFDLKQLSGRLGLTDSAGRTLSLEWSGPACNLYYMTQAFSKASIDSVVGNGDRSKV